MRGLENSKPLFLLCAYMDVIEQIQSECASTQRA